ncbi:MAG: cysteine desulfurase [Bacteroidetes bacterium]|nr:cysteine desulfurase [Bacteroidota bacterium]
MIYLDNSATTRIDDDVLEAMLPWLRDGYGNASSVYALGRSARVAIEDARTEIASLMNAHPAELIFTSGGTEANNTILKSCLYESALVRRIVHSPTEHHAILHPLDVIRQQGGEVHTCSVDENGRVDPASLVTFNDASTLLTVMHANNETGVLQPIAALRAAMPQMLIHTDAVQSFGKVPFDVQALGVDLASFSAHKIHGPKGVGAMFIRKGLDLKAHQQGGAQERNRRAGTEPTALIVGFQVAARKAVAALDDRATHMRSLIDRARALIAAEIPNVRLNTPLDETLPHILNLSFLDAEKIDGESLLQSTDMRGLAVSNGSACVSGSLQPSHVLKAMGRSDAEARAAVRLSVSKDTTVDEIEKAVAILSDIVRIMRG